MSKHQTPSSKFQRRSKSQEPNPLAAQFPCAALGSLDTSSIEKALELGAQSFSGAFRPSYAFSRAQLVSPIFLRVGKRQGQRVSGVRRGNLSQPQHALNHS